VQQQGAVSIGAYITYLTAGWSYFGPIIVVFIYLATQGLIIASDYWLSNWATQEQNFDFEKTKCSVNATAQNDTNCTKFYLNINDPTTFISNKIYENRTERFNVYLSLNLT
jgi:hypothetical protein